MPLVVFQCFSAIKPINVLFWIWVVLFLPLRSECQESIQLNSGNNYILSIGIDDYQNWLDLTNAKNDALGITDVLVDYYGFQPIIEPIIDANATKVNIMNAIEKVKSKINADDNLIIFFAGHGYSKEIDVGPYRKTVSYLATHDSESIYTDAEAHKIRLNNFLELLSEMPARHVCFFIDACQSGVALEESTVRISRGSPLNVDKSSLRISRKVFTSAKADQLALDTGPIPNHSVYTGFLIDGLKNFSADQDGNEIISSGELALYVQSKVKDFTNNDQIPDYGAFGLDNRGELNLVPKIEKIEAHIQENNSEYVRNKNPDNKLTYSTLAFRSMASDTSLHNFGSWIAETILQGLVDNTSNAYRTIRPEIIKSKNINYAENAPYKSVLKGYKNLQLFQGTYFVDEDILTIKMQLVDFDSGQIKYAFPDLKGKFSEKDELLVRLKQTIQGFLATKDMTLKGLQAPPLYDAFKLVQKAKTYASDRIKLRKTLDKAIEIDSTYYYAHHLYATSYLDGDHMNIRKAQEYVQKIYQMELAKTAYEEDMLEGLHHEVYAEYDKVVDLLFLRLNNKKYSRSWSTIWNIGIYCELSNKMSDLDRLFSQVELSKQEAQYMAGFKLNQFLQRGSIDKEYSYYHSIANRPYWPDEILATYILFNSASEKSIDSLIQDLFLKISNDSQKINLLIDAGKTMEFKGKKQNAKDFYRRALKKAYSTPELSENIKLEVEYRMGNYENVIQFFEENEQMMFEKKRLRAIEYYVLSKHNLEQSLSEEKMDEIYNYLVGIKDSKPHSVAYMKAKFSATTESPEIAISKLKQAYKSGMGFGFFRYDSDPDLKMLYDHPEFISFCRPK